MKRIQREQNTQDAVVEDHIIVGPICS